MDNKYVRMEQTLLDASKATLEKQKIILSADNYSDMMYEGLKSIIEEGKYICFTGDNGHRKKMRQFKPEEFRSMICNKLIEYGEDEVVFDFYANSDGKSISRSCLERWINLYSKYVASSLDEMYMVSDDDMIAPTIDLVERLHNVKFYPPSNECRRAVMNGTQGRVKFSEAKNAGMMAYSDQGKVRDNNEDSYYIGVHPANPDFKIMLVADGMGGHEKGEVASNIATREMIKWFESLPEDYFNGDNYLLSLLAQTAVKNIHEKINFQCHGGGTTLCFAIIKKDNIFIGNIGDSRGFVTENGKLVFSTNPDSLPISIGVPEPFDKFHSRNNFILNCLGGGEDMDEPQLHFNTVVMDKNARYDIVLCSDGVTDCLDNKEIMDIMRSGDDVSYRLVEAALNNNLSFHDELDKAKKKAGIIGRGRYKKLLSALEKEYDMDIRQDKIIHGGKDNTTAVYSGEVRRGR